jgi:hypothetical protein
MCSKRSGRVFTRVDILGGLADIDTAGKILYGGIKEHAHQDDPEISRDYICGKRISTKTLMRQLASPAPWPRVAENASRRFTAGICLVLVRFQG